uniref:Rad50/SbcC-type AAA domain-containing protein n=1 Tax=Desulfacinum infernum TaxID=35837 RepID=A0A832EKP3_9BACT
MIHRLVIQNFMTHKNTVLDLHRGVTVLTGPNNTGKSAVVEAIRCVAENPPSAQLIRHGASKAVVRLELDDGTRIQWERTAGAALYKVLFPDGTEETYAKVGRGAVPDDIRRLLRLHSLETDAGPIDVHIGNQRTPIFLLDQSGSQAAGFFAASTEAEYLLAMQQLLKERAAQAQRDRRRLQETIQAIDKNLQAFDALPTVAQAMQEAEGLYARLEVLRRAIPALNIVIQQAETLRDRCRTLSRTSQSLENLHTPPPLHETTPLLVDLQKLEKTIRLLKKTDYAADTLASLDGPPALKDTARLHALHTALDRMGYAVSQLSAQSAIHSQTEPPPTLFDTPALAHLTQRLEETQNRRRAEEHRRQAIQPLGPPPELNAVPALVRMTETMEALLRSLETAQAKHRELAHLEPLPEVRDPAGLIRITDALDRCRQAMDILEARKRRLAVVEPPPSLRDPEPLQRLLDHMEQLHNQCARALDQRETLEQQLEEKRREVQALIEVMPLCPFCRQPLNAEHFLEADHG